MTSIPTELRELLERIVAGDVGRMIYAKLATGQATETDDGKAWLELRALLATPPADAADMGGQAGEDGERNRAFKACPNSGCDWGAFYLGWKAKAKDLVSIRAALESQHRQQAGKLVEAEKTDRPQPDKPAPIRHVPRRRPSGDYECPCGAVWDADEGTDCPNL